MIYYLIGQQICTKERLVLSTEVRTGALRLLLRRAPALHRLNREETDY